MPRPPRSRRRRSTATTKNASSPKARDRCRATGKPFLLPGPAGRTTSRFPPRRRKPPSRRPVAAPTKGVAWSPKASGGRRPAPAIPPRVRAWLPAILAVLVVLLAALYFLSGAVLSPLSSEGETAAGTAAASAEWISIFDGTQLGIIATPSGGTVDSVTVRGDPAVRLAPAGEGGEINVAIGPGVVREIQGQTVRVELVAGSSDGASREFGVRCLFGGETVCARQRFQTTQARDTFVFDMAVPRGGNAAGVLAIDPTLAAATGDLDLYSIRLQPVPAS